MPRIVHMTLWSNYDGVLIPEEGKEVSRYIHVLNRHLARTSSFGRLQTTKSGKIQKEAHFSQDTILPLAGVYPRPSCTSAIGPPGVNFIVEVGLFGVRLPMVNEKPGAKMSYLHLLPGDAMPAHVRWRESWVNSCQECLGKSRFEPSILIFLWICS